MHSSRLLFPTLPALALAALLGSAAQAQEYDNRSNVYTGALYEFIDSEVNQDDDFGWLLGGELGIGQRWGLALEGWNVETGNEPGPGDSELDVFRVGGNYHLAPRGLWQPYLGFGVGQYEIDPRPTSPGADAVTFDVGVGVKRFFNDNLFLRGDAKLLRVSEVGAWDQTVSLAIGYAFGPRSSPPVAAAPAPTPAPVVEVDPDSDGDGVPDSRDRCPNTPRELAVDADGCPILDSSQLRQELLVEFDFDMAVIRNEFFDEVAEFAQFMTTYANTDVVIEGHTDNVGTEAYNQDLSERRARAVMNRLINTHGIAATRLSAVGYGESRPVVANDTDANRARNRRIEAAVTVQIQVQRRR